MKETSAIKTNIGNLLKKVENEKVLKDIQALLKTNPGKAAAKTKDQLITFTGLQKQ